MVYLLAHSVEVPLPNQSEWGLSETKRIKYMTEPEARELMDSFMLDKDKREILWPFVGTLRASHSSTKLDPTPPEPAEIAQPTPNRRWHAPDPDRPLWLVTAWICGASYSVLAMMHGVSEQAIQQSVSRSMGVDERHISRIGYRLERERVDELRIKYYTNVLKLRNMHPVECAKWLIQEENDE